jgi:GH15 family glucan-1,4-alpha-glucosidase
MPRRIEDYALIGDCETAALVGRDGSIDWLCWPRFDSDACFAALLGEPEHGRWLIAARDGAARRSWSYRDSTLILETRIETADAAVRVIDFMPPRPDHASSLMRLIIAERGEMEMHTELVIRFGYGAIVPWMTRVADDTWRAIAGPDMVMLRTNAALRGKDLKTVADFVVRAGEPIAFTLTYSRSYSNEISNEPSDVDEALVVTERYWRDWVARARGIENMSPAVTRSLITLRALIHRPTGGIIAAPTTSLPERAGGERNWDYRYCWLRDATLALLALMNAGYYDEAKAWRDWLLRAIAGAAPQMQIMYGVAGERRLSEWEVPWLPGYEGARPVRVGNAASTQLQLDVLGEVMDAFHQARKGGLAQLESAWALQRQLLAYLASIWEQPDYGIWEVRGPARHFTYSKIMVWVAFDRAIKDCERYQLEAPVDEWRALRERIHKDVCERGYEAQRNCFVQSYGSTQLDASLLLLPALGFLPADDPRVTGTIRAIESRLLRDGFVHRYDTAQTDDGLPPGEGAFLACSFWLADAYAMCGRHEEAQALFERLVGLANDVGLLAEEYDPAGRRLMGNFPQGFSHLALINTAFNLAHADKPAQQRSEAHV